MNGKDIFNTVNEIDAKLITDAWENTEPYCYPLSMRQDSGKASKLKAFGIAAAFAAVICVTAAIVFIRSGAVPTLPSQSSPGVSFVDAAALYGPDHNPIPENYKIVTDTTASAADGAEPIIVCDDCVYLAEAFGGNFNSIDNPRMFPENSWESYFHDIEPVYHLYKVGDKFGDLTVSKAQVCFKKNDGTSAGEIVNSYVNLDGTITLKAYILLNERAETGRKIICVPMRDETALPIITADLDPESGNYVSRRYYAQYLSGNFKCSTELPSRILLHTFGITMPDFSLPIFSDKWNMNDFLDRKIAKLLTEGNGIAAVTLELSNIYMKYSPDGSSITANIETISRYEPYTGDLPFELYGPDHKQLKYEDISEVTTVNGYKVSFDELSDVTISNIKCNDFTYFRLPGSDEFKRYDVSDNVNGMRILSASSTLSSRKSQDSYYTGGEAMLWGSVTMQTAMLRVNGQIYIANTLIPTTVDDCVFTITTGSTNSYMSSCIIVSESEFERLMSLPGGIATTNVMIRIGGVSITDNGKTVNVTLLD